MRSVIIGIFIAIAVSGAAAQRPAAKAKQKAAAATPTASPTPVPEPTPTPDPAVTESQDFDAAHAATALSSRVSLLEKFITDYPESARLPEARESLMIARSSLADEMLEAGDVAGGVALLKRTVEESPEDTPDGMFGEVIMKIPGNLYFRGRRQEAFEIATAIEKRFESNAARLTGLAAFHLAIENGADAVRLANRAIELAPESSAAYQALGTAHRLNFDLDAAAVAFLKAYELDQASVSAKRGLADINRAAGRSDQAAALYRQILAENENDIPARAGLILSLFESGKRPQAELELAGALEKNPNNLPLLAGAAYWYAANNEGAKAIEYAQKAIALEPRYVWSHIALARGQIAEGKPVDAEKTLISARKYGNFPTLDYEIAIARLSAGFFRDAIEGLEKSFVFQDDEIRTRLGGRIERSNTDIGELIAAERQSSILSPRAPDDREAAERLRSLNLFLSSIGSETASPEAAAAAAERFVEGRDPMRVHRALYAASLLLEKKLAVDKAAELVSSATGTAESGLTVPNPSAAVMAVELYEARALAASRGEFLLVPEVPQKTLSAILRGRVEELAGWALLEQGRSEEAAVRFKRAVSVLPENSAWWRAAKWRLGSSLALQGNEKDALEQYIQGYDKDRPDIVKYMVVESLYRKLNNGIDGLEARIGPNPLPPASSPAEEPKPVTEISAQTPAPTEPADAAPKPVETIKVAETPQAAAEPPKTEPADVPKTEPAPETSDKPAVPTIEKKAENLPVPDAPKNEPGNLPPDPPKTDEPTPAKAELQVPEKQAEKPDEKPIEPERPVEIKPDPAKPPTDPEAKQPTETEAVKLIPANAPTTESESPRKTEPENSESEKTEPAAEPKAKTSTEANASASKEPKPLFEPIIITIPSNKNKTAAAPAESAGEDSAKPAVEIPPCKIDVSQDNISLISGGGTIGILVSVEEGTDIKTVKATSISPDDVEVILEPEIAGLNGRAFYIIRSKSNNVGIYQVSFTAPCGKKEVLVQVR